MPSSAPHTVESTTLIELRVLDAFLERVRASTNPEQEVKSALEEIESQHPALRARFLQMLWADEDTECSWDGEEQNLLDVVRPYLQLKEGEQLGPWTIESELGRGGMGVVYEVSREHQALHQKFTQKGALKIITTSTLSTQEGVLPYESFLREMSLLSSLAQHPHIAQFLDAGVAPGETPHPFFVMEHIDGEPLHRFCDAKCLGVMARVELFLQVIGAVHFMHIRGVIHRDLKPQNILVTHQGHCKLLDLGIAQTAHTPQTNAFTPAWSSPEQREGLPLTVATDIFNLGLLLQLLVLGETSLESQSVSLKTLWSTMSQERREAGAKARGYIAPEQWHRELSMELEAILFKALQPEAHDRYESAKALADDLRAWRKGDRIQALSHEPRYAMWHTLRRYKIPISLAALLIVVLITASFSLWSQNRAILKEQRNTEAARAKAQEEANANQELADFLANLLTNSNPSQTGARHTTVETVLDQSAARMMQPGPKLKSTNVRARLLRVMADSYLGLGLEGKALPLLKESQRLQGDSLKTPECLGRGNEAARWTLSWAKGIRGAQKQRSKQMLETLLKECALTAPPAQGVTPHTFLQQVYLTLGSLTYWDLRELNAAAQYYQHALNIIQEDSVAKIDALIGISLVKHDQNAPYQDHIKTLHAIADKLLGEHHPERARIYKDLAFLTPKLEDRVALFHKNLSIFKKTYGPKHMLVASTMNDLALAIETSDPEQSYALMEKAYLMAKEQLPKDHHLRQTMSSNWGSMLREMGRLDEAEELLLYNHQQRPTIFTMSNLATLRHKQGRLKEAIKLNTQGLTLLPKDPGELNFGYRAEFHKRNAGLYEELREYENARQSWAKSIHALSSNRSNLKGSYAQNIARLHVLEAKTKAQK